jgi:hypothetical protein
LKIGDIDLFRDNLGATHDLGMRIFQPEFMNDLQNLLKILPQSFLDVLEPRRIRQVYSGQYLPDTLILNVLSLYTYLQSILRWKRAILRLDPKSQQMFVGLSECYAIITRGLFALQDYVETREPEVVPLELTIHLYEIAVHLNALDFIKRSAADSLINILEGRLRLYFARLDGDENNFSLTVAVDCIPGGFAFVSPHCRGRSKLFWRLLKQAPHPTVAQCIGSTHKHGLTNKNFPDPTNVHNCFCGWVSACFPEHLLTIFGYTHESLSYILHKQNGERDWPRILFSEFLHKAVALYLIQEIVSYSIRVIFRLLDSEFGDPLPNKFLVFLILITRIDSMARKFLMVAKNGEDFLPAAIRESKDANDLPQWVHEFLDDSNHSHEELQRLFSRLSDTLLTL